MKRVVVAGGGTAGWIAAAALVKRLGALLAITLVESDEIGESTGPAVPYTRAIAHEAGWRWRIALFHDNAIAYQGNDELFRNDSWILVMLGQGIEPCAYHHIARMMDPAKLRQVLTDLKAGIAANVAKLPPHQRFVEEYAAAG